MKPVKHKPGKAQRDALAADLSERMRNLVPEAVAVFLFGSFARGEDFSDLDIGILMGRDVMPPLKFELNLEVRLQRTLKYPVDVRLLDAAPLSFIDCLEIVRTKRRQPAPIGRSPRTGNVLTIMRPLINMRSFGPGGFSSMPNRTGAHRSRGSTEKSISTLRSSAGVI
jgi:predicted nucleotidyltransferase